MEGLSPLQFFSCLPLPVVATLWQYPLSSGSLVQDTLHCCALFHCYLLVGHLGRHNPALARALTSPHMHPTVASCSIIIPLSEHQHRSAASRNHCIRPASPLSMYCGGATHFMLHIAGSGALNNPFNPPIIDRETAICPVPGTAQTTSGEFVRPKDHVHTFFS